MKSLKLGLLTLLLCSSAAYSLNPIPGLYAGLIVGGSKAPDINFNVITPIQDLSGQGQDLSGQGVITYSVLGNIGGQVGYRINQLRVEGGFIYNNNSYSHMEVGGINIPNSNSLQTSSTSNPFTFSGYTNTYAVMFNGIYDVYIPNYTDNVVPYVGLGVGYEHVENNLIIYNNGATTPNSVISRYTNNFAGQAIVGLSYFVTDYTSWSLDFRYLSALRSTEDTTFNSFQSRPQLYSVNLLVNLAFNLA